MANQTDISSEARREPAPDRVPDRVSDHVSDRAHAPAPVEGRDPWLKDLRLRFGLMLALALLPWLIFTALEAFNAHKRSRLNQAQTLDVLTANTVTDIANLLELGRLSLEGFPAKVAAQGCEAAGKDMLARLPAFQSVELASLDGSSTCRVPPDAPRYNPSWAPEQDAAFQVLRGRPKGRATADTLSDDPDDVVMLRLNDGQSVQTLILPRELGLTQMMDATMSDAARIALTRPDGRSIIGRTSSKEENAAYLAAVSQDGVSYIDYELDGEARRGTVRYSPSGDLFVTLGRPADAVTGNVLFNPVTAIFLPILAWLIGFSLIWMGTQSMLIRPIRRVRLAARKFARGDLESRVKLRDDAAREVQGLALTFNRMAGQLQEREDRIADNLDEKDTLMREIHHRVKNNLQIIISLLNMQERKAETSEAITAISETRSRINAIAIVHRGLYESDDLRFVDVPLYMGRLLSSVSESLSLDEAGVTLTHDCEAMGLPADMAIAIALFTIEAVSNAKAHGVERGGTIHVSVGHVIDDGTEAESLRVRVVDDGCGVGNPSAMSGVGTKLMKGFARQLGGRLTFADNNPGLIADLIVPPASGDGNSPFRLRKSR